MGAGACFAGGAGAQRRCGGGARRGLLSLSKSVNRTRLECDVALHIRGERHTQLRGCARAADPLSLADHHARAPPTPPPTPPTPPPPRAQTATTQTKKKKKKRRKKKINKKSFFSTNQCGTAAP